MLLIFDSLADTATYLILSWHQPPVSAEIFRNLRQKNFYTGNRRYFNILQNESGWLIEYQIKFFA